jgi:hypothetical protein
MLIAELSDVLKGVTEFTAPSETWHHRRAKPLRRQDPDRSYE